MSVRLRLFLASALMLFTELMLIRWLGANLLHLSYFSNIVLLGSFLGIGLGFLVAKPDRRRGAWFAPALAVLLLAVPFIPGGVDQTGSDLIYFTAVSTEGAWPPVVTLTLVFVAVAAVLMGPAIMVAECFFELPRLDAYRFDLLGSLAGTVSFAVLSYVGAGPVVWSIVIAALVLALVGGSRLTTQGIAVVALGVVVYSMSVGVLREGDIWSPYYKIQVIDQVATDQAGTQTPAYAVIANGVPHQAIVDLDFRLEAEPFYAQPYERITEGPVGDVLVVGAGNGSDVALALRQGATSVDAVEIDPRIKQLGVELHPQKPYDDPRVTPYIGDGRAFLHTTDKKYDLVIFALPDSLTLVAGSNQLRLESYLFTQEALEDVKAVLKPGGAFAMYNYYRENWLIGRLANTAEAAFGHAPCVDAFRARSAVIVAGLTEADQRCGDPAVDASVVTDLSGPPPVHDERPFLYLKDASIPGTFLLVIVMVLLVSLIAVRVIGGPLRRMAPYADLACLGAAFLLLETRAVTWSALLFGTTWVVNAIVFAGVLIVVLLAVEVTRRMKKRPSRPVAFGFLGATLLIAWLVPTSWLLSLPMGLRVVVAVAIAFGPVFASNIVFATRFDTTEDATGAFAANLLGAMVGGCLEYLALVVGYPALLGLAALLYAGAFLLGPKVKSPVPVG
ncbi:spermidine synthase [Longivirga aurantiaca]|uniref:Spermidine synthase n=1 Tax=Longivirga aurantiaca TaxID=1837743 RepID=A0ABW1SYR4_9ACTN